MIFHQAMRWSGLALYGVGLLGVAYLVGTGGLELPFRLAVVVGGFCAFVGGALWGFHQR